MAETISLPYCPRCGEKSFHAGDFKPWHCSSCDFKFYPNIAAAAGVFVFDQEGRILMTERAHEPRQGKLGLPGGFLEADETAEAGLAREVEEEVGIQITDLKYLCSAPNRYAFGGIVYNTLDLFYTATAVSKSTEIDPAEVVAVHWKQLEDIQTEELAFQSFQHAFEELRRYLSHRD